MNDKRSVTRSFLSHRSHWIVETRVRNLDLYGQELRTEKVGPLCPTFITSMVYVSDVY